ncbi:MULTISPECIES: hypothetical protein [unclassified Variovorax]|uniref:hypothetical protein n=1 Tax=unclassified Variovorax TaxID=663243 RepID=UPI001BD24734|nr:MULTISPECIES: hypothetical protein [unclassified Variovorax]
MKLLLGEFQRVIKRVEADVPPMNIHFGTCQMRLGHLKATGKVGHSHRGSGIWEIKRSDLRQLADLRVQASRFRQRRKHQIIGHLKRETHLPGAHTAHQDPGADELELSDLLFPMRVTLLLVLAVDLPSDYHRADQDGDK